MSRKLDVHKDYNELNPYVISWGIFYAILFTLAVGYLCLKLGQTVDAGTPVSILAIGMGAMLKRIDPFPENVHIQALACSGTNIVGCVMFILPAMYILNLPPISAAMLVVPVMLGGLLGVFLATIFRHYFVVDMEDAYPFPGGQAAAEVLSSGEGSNAKLMVVTGLISLVYDFVLNTVGLWSEVISTRLFAWGKALEASTKLTFSLDMDTALLGIGYFTGLRYGAIIAAGSFFSWCVCIPLVYFFGGDYHMVVAGKEMLLADAPTRVVFTQYVRHVGIGMLAMAGVIGLISMSSVVSGIVKKAIVDIFKPGQAKAEAANTTRDDRDLPTIWVAAGMIACIALFGIFFHIFYSPSILITIVSLIIVSVLAFLLSIVGISSIAFTGSEPVSGMTIFMLLVTCVTLGAMGVAGTSGMITILVLASFLAAALGVAGMFMAQLKICRIVRATPAKMEKVQLPGIAISAIVSIGVMILLNEAYGFVGDGALAAPQANAMAAIISPLMTGGSAPWALYMAGAFFAVILWMVKVPPLAFALGAYLPMEINVPVLIGGFLAYLASHSSKDEKLNELRFNEGSTAASGLIAGGALGSLLSAVLHIGGLDIFMEAWNATPAAACLGLVLYLLVFVFIYKAAVRIKKA